MTTDAAPDADRPVGLRERHKRRTRAAIRVAAMTLFTENGYAATTVGEIAERAEVSHTTFFRYFPTKEDVIIADDAFEHRSPMFEGLPPGLSAFDAVRHELTALYEWAATDAWASDRRRLRLIRSEPLLLAAAHNHFQTSMRHGRIALGQYLGVDPDSTALRVFLAAVAGAINEMSGVDGAQDPVSLDTLLATVDLVQRGAPV